MKIAIITQYYPDPADPAGGVYVHVRAAGYVAAGHAVRVYRVRPHPGPTQRFEHERVQVLASETETAAAELRAFDPDVIALHTPYRGTPHTIVAETSPAPRVVWIHGYEAMLTALHGYHRGLAVPLSVLHDLGKLWHLRRALRGAVAAVYVSGWTRRLAERNTLFRHPRTRVIPNPVDLDWFSSHTSSIRNDASRGLALRPLRAVQGLDLAVSAYAGLDDTELTIIGLGPEAGRLRAQIARLPGRVTLQERSLHHWDVPALMADYDYFVCPARSATQCVAMCEAMACGLPVVATAVGGIPEFVRHGIDGLLVRPGSPDRLRRALRELVSDPERAREMGRNAREHVAAKCSVAQVIAAELQLLSEVAE